MKITKDWISVIKLYAFGPDYYAAKNLRDAIRSWRDMSSGTIREALEEVHEMSEKEMEHYTFHDDIYNADIEEPKPGTFRSFKEQLNKMIEAGEKFPCPFASSEY